MNPRQSWACFMGFRNCWALFMYFWKCRASLVNFREYRASLVDFRKYRASLVDGSCQEEAKLTPSISSKINALEAGRFRCGRQLGLWLGSCLRPQMTKQVNLLPSAR